MPRRKENLKSQEGSGDVPMNPWDVGEPLMEAEAGGEVGSCHNRAGAGVGMCVGEAAGVAERKLPPLV